MFPWLRVRSNLPERGNGLFARCRIPNGAFVCDYVGKYVANHVHDDKVAQLRMNGDDEMDDRIEGYLLKVSGSI